MRACLKVVTIVTLLLTVFACGKKSETVFLEKMERYMRLQIKFRFIILRILRWIHLLRIKQLFNL